MGMDSLDDFGVDLYVIFELVISKIDLDENICIVVMFNMIVIEW